MTGFADRFREEGMREGLQQGMQQGEALVLVRLMERRFGSLAPQLRRRIEQADAERGQGIDRADAQGIDGGLDGEIHDASTFEDPK